MITTVWKVTCRKCGNSQYIEDKDNAYFKLLNDLYDENGLVSTATWKAVNVIVPGAMKTDHEHIKCPQ